MPSFTINVPAGSRPDPEDNRETLTHAQLLVLALYNRATGNAGSSTAHNFTEKKNIAVAYLRRDMERGVGRIASSEAAVDSDAADDVVNIDVTEDSDAADDVVNIDVTEGA